MMAGVSDDRRSRRITAVGTLGAALGVLLFAWFVRRVGTSEIWAGLREVGWGLILITAIAGLRFAARAFAWMACLERPHHLSFRNAFEAVVAGDTFGNLIPLGPLVGEPAKAAYVRGTVPLGAALTALAIENILYSLSAAAMIAAGTIVLLFTVDLPIQLRIVGQIAVVSITFAFVLLSWALWRRPAIVSRMLAMMLPSSSALHSRMDRVRAVEQDVYTFMKRRGGAVVPIGAAELTFHALGVVEVYVTWWLMLGSPTSWLTAFLLESANRLITVVFKFVPLRIGVDEAGTGQFTSLLGYGAAPGATLAIVRKIRIIFWALVGTSLLVRRGLSPSLVTRSLDHSRPDPDRPRRES